MPTEQLSPTIRWASGADLGNRREIIRQAWEEAYGHIFSGEEIEGVFQNRLPQRSTWTANRIQTLGGIVAEIEGKMVGTAAVALLDNGDGELTSLYVAPEYQGNGIGLTLWEKAIAVLRENSCRGMQVWVLEKAPAVRFYEGRGCVRIGSGTYYIGSHAENTLGYRIPLS